MDASTSLNWSSTFTILPPSAPYCQNLLGDKIILPHSALEQLLAAASSQSSRTVGNDPFSFHHGSDFANAYVHDQGAQQLPNPLMFRLLNAKNNNVVYAGIKEFSAPEGAIGLSPFLLEALDIKPDDFVAVGGSVEDPVDLTGADASSKPSSLSVRAVRVPKGTYVRLRPLEAGYSPDDWKPLLERQLRQSFTLLTKNTVLSVRGAQGEDFKLLVDKFAPEGDGICVVDTDLEVDIEALNEEQARETLRRKLTQGPSASASGSSRGGELDIWKDIDGHVLRGDYVDYVLPSWDRSQNLSITLSGVSDEDSLDLFVTPKSRQQRALPRDSVHVFGNFSPANHGNKAITIISSNVELEGAESILVSVHAYASPNSTEKPGLPLSYVIRARVSPIRGNEASEPIEIQEDEHSLNDEQCKNCLQWVPKRTIILHQNFCLRNNVLCPKCKAVFKKGSPEWEAHWHCEHDDAQGNSPASREKHDEIFHAHRTCTGCEFSTNSLADLARHRTTTCPGKIILCRFCHLEVPQEGDPFNPSPEVVLSGMTSHELADGSRTTECHLCDKIVRLRDMEMHLKHHELDKVGRSKPEICRNANCGRTVYGVGARGQLGTPWAEIKAPGNDIGLCSVCFGPLYVSLHDPDGKALRRRIERRYLSQMMTGCGKSHCGNEWCKTGRANTGLEARGASAGALLPLVKPLLPGALDPAEPAYFCVDEASQTGRRLAEMVAAENVWDFEWCVAAAEAERSDLNRMREWLDAWAPRK